jgi:hypothetical protein
MSWIMRTCDGCGREVAARSATLRILCLACHPGDLPMSEQEAETWPNADEVNAGCDRAIAEARAAVIHVPPMPTDLPAQPDTDKKAVYELAARAFMANVPKTQHNHWDETMRWQRDHPRFRAAIDAARAPLLAQLAAARAGVQTRDTENARLTEELQHVHEDVLGDAKHEVNRLIAALQVCEFVLHRVDPTDAEQHAGQQAAGAWITEWLPAEVLDDLADFAYSTVDQRKPSTVHDRSCVNHRAETTPPAR